MRHLVRFFVLGALLYFAKGGLQQERGQPALPTLRVVIKDSASDAELERAIDEAVLVEQAVARAGALLDPVVREQLLVAMRGRPRREGAEREPEAEDDAALLERAVALGLHRADPVARQRLMFQAEQLLMARAQSAQVADAELTRYLGQHAERYATPPRFSFTHVFLSRTRRGAALAGDAAKLLTRLSREQRSEPAAPLGARTEPPASASLGDPTLLPRSFDESPAVTVDARFGPGFASALRDLPEGVWSGPVPSAYGLHLVLIRAQLPGRPPALAEVRARVLADYRHDQRRSVLRAQLRALRSGYRLDVRRLRA